MQESQWMRQYLTMTAGAAGMPLGLLEHDWRFVVFEYLNKYNHKI